MKANGDDVPCSVNLNHNFLQLPFELFAGDFLSQMRWFVSQSRCSSSDAPVAKTVMCTWDLYNVL